MARFSRMIAWSLMPHSCVLMKRNSRMSLWVIQLRGTPKYYLRWERLMRKEILRFSGVSMNLRRSERVSVRDCLAYTFQSYRRAVSSGTARTLSFCKNGLSTWSSSWRRSVDCPTCSKVENFRSSRAPTPTYERKMDEYGRLRSSSKTYPNRPLRCKHSAWNPSPIMIR